MSSLNKSQSCREQLCEKLKGQEFIMPDLTALLPGWKSAVNPHYKASKRQYISWASNLTDDKDLQRVLLHTDWTLLTAYWYPEASQERLTILSIFMGWGFAFDESFDLAIGNKHDLIAGKHIADTLWAVNTSLTHPYPSAKDLMTEIGRWEVARWFCDIGLEISKELNAGIKMFLDEHLVKLTEYTNAETLAEFKYQLTQTVKEIGIVYLRHQSGGIPNLDEFNNSRKWTVGSVPFFALIE
ncbi:hypothetical protein FE257_003552 [Aspergillus nanangensis]|uniref:Terpene synthase n=1 Tax=Aspergillus nanangensis TaxID=2582783 RepID=A0AAD4CBD8_ASPNN|nr:hypothetical protein FE257_003552 [Aspergillus nanangensis]